MPTASITSQVETEPVPLPATPPKKSRSVGPVAVEPAAPATPPSAATMKFESEDIKISDLLLDPNNYRFLDNKDFKRKPENRYASEKVQGATLRLLTQDKRYQLDELRKSILTNGYVPMERIIVVRYEPKPGKFLVVEGNRRVAALKSLIQDNEEEVLDLTSDQVASFSKIPCAILVVEKAQRRHAERVIMGIRHITGPREWGAYQQAQLIQQLHDEEQQEFASIAEHLGLSTVEVARRYRAMNALKTMERDDLYSEKAEPEFYRLLHELVSLPDVRKRFGWDADAVRQHLQTLPGRITAEPAKYNDEHRTTATINSMLMNALIPRGVSVERLNLPFIERVCNRYFRKVGQRWYLRGEAVAGEGGSGLITEEVNIKDEVTAIDWLRQKLQVRPMLVGEIKPYWQKAMGLLPSALSQSLELDNLLTENFWRDLDTNRWREPTAEERERMNDDLSLRVLHDAERFVAGTLNRPSTDDDRCRWIDVLFQACRAVEDKEMDALPALRGFDQAEAYSLITRLFQSILKEHVSADVFRRVEKQYRAAATRLASQAENDKQTDEKARKKDHNQTTLDLF